MPRITDEHRTAMTHRIETAALTCASKKGFAAMSMSDIIKESGLSAGAIYGYYASKDELVAAMARRVVGNRAALLDELAERRPVPHPALGMQEFMTALDGPMVEAGLVLQIWGLASSTAAIGEIASGAYGQLIEHAGIYLAAWLEHERGLTPEAAAERGLKLAPAAIALVQGWLFKVAVMGIKKDSTYFESVEALLEGL